MGTWESLFSLDFMLKTLEKRKIHKQHNQTLELKMISLIHNSEATILDICSQISPQLFTRAELQAEITHGSLWVNIEISNVTPPKVSRKKSNWTHPSCENGGPLLELRYTCHPPKIRKFETRNTYSQVIQHFLHCEYFLTGSYSCWRSMPYHSTPTQGLNASELHRISKSLSL